MPRFDRGDEVELDDGGLITYEEYHPYGSVAWKAEKALMDVGAKRYRYTGMERDDETGLQVHGVRYYAPWLGRWSRPDAAGSGDGTNRFVYTHQSPTTTKDVSGFAPESGDPTSEVLPDGTKAETPEDARKRGEARVIAGKKENDKLISNFARIKEEGAEAAKPDPIAKNKELKSEAAGAIEIGSRGVDFVPVASQHLTRMGIDRSFFLQGVGVGEQPPRRDPKKNPKKDTILKGDTDPGTGNIVMYIDATWGTAVHEPIHGFVLLHEIPQALEDAIRKDLIKGIAVSQGISITEASEQLANLDEKDQASLVEESIAFDVTQRIVALSGAPGMDDGIEGFDKTTTVVADRHVVETKFSRRTRTLMNQFLGIDIPTRRPSE